MYPVYAAFLASHNITETAAMKYFSPETSLHFCMRYEVLLAEAMNKSYKPLTTGSVLKQVGRYYDRHGSR